MNDESYPRKVLRMFDVLREYSALNAMVWNHLFHDFQLYGLSFYKKLIKILCEF